MANLKTIKVANLSGTNELGQKLGSNLKGGEIIELISDLGGGKTSLVKAIARGAGSSDLVSSPSFTLCNQYQAKGFIIYHFDFYRLTDPGIMKRELGEVIGDKKTVVIIEWPTVIEDILPSTKLRVKLTTTGRSSREINLDYPPALSYLVETI